MVIQKWNLSNYIVVSLVFHVLLASLLLLTIPKHEKFIPIEIHFGELGSKGTGHSGAGKSHAQFKSSSSTVPTLPKAAPKAKAPEKVKANTLSKAVPNNSDSTSTVKSEEVSSPSNAVGGASTGVAGNESANNGNGKAGSGGAGADTPLARYVQKIVLLIESHKNYPQRAKYLGQEGTVSLKIVIDREGKLLEMEVLEAPPFKLLVEAATKTISEIGSFPPMPADVSLDTVTLNVPIRFRLME